MKVSFISMVENHKEIIAAALPTAVSCCSTLFGNTSVTAAIYAFCGFVVTVLLLAMVRLISAKRDNDVRVAEQKKITAQAELESKKAASFDFKMSASTESSSFVNLVSLWKRNGVSVDQMKDGDARFCSSDQLGYVSAAELLDPDKKWNAAFSVAPMRNADKNGKCIVQLSFIPMDENGKIPIILRMPEWHSNDVTVEAIRPAKLTFVSFSPVPISFKRPFNAMDCYHREVPDRKISGVSSSLQELGSVIKRVNGTTYYLFYAFAVKYNGCSFADDEGNLNLKVVNPIFATDATNMSWQVEYFAKDHDKIIGAAIAADIDYVIGSREHKENAPQWLKNLFSDKDYIVETEGKDPKDGTPKVYTERFDMTKADLGGVEKKIIQKLMI